MNKVLIGLVASLAATVAQAAPTQVQLTNADFEDISGLLEGQGFYRGVNGWAKLGGGTSCKGATYRTAEDSITGNPGTYNGAISSADECALYQNSVDMKKDATYTMTVQVCTGLGRIRGDYKVFIGLADPLGGAPTPLAGAESTGTAPAAGSCTLVSVSKKIGSVNTGDKVALYLGKRVGTSSSGAPQVEFNDVTLTEEEAVVIDPDSDGDGTPDSRDNCPLVPNADQADLDGDGVGDECDPDKDGDGVANGADNCPLDANATQADADYDGIGDACDSQFDAGSVAGYLDGQASQAAAAIEAANVPGGTGMVNLLDGIGLALDQALNAYLAGQISAEVYQERLSMLLNRTVAFDNQVNAKERSRHLDSATANALRTVAQNMRDAINAMLANP